MSKVVYKNLQDKQITRMYHALNTLGSLVWHKLYNAHLITKRYHFIVNSLTLNIFT